jgi:hypothetical protein
MNDFNSNSLTSDIGHVKDEMKALGKEIEKVVEKLAGLSTGLKGAMNSGPGGNTGSGQLKLGSSGNNLLGKSFGAISLLSGVLGPAIKGSFGVAGAALAALPNVSTTMGMAQGAYGAAVTSATSFRNAYSYQDVLRGTFNGLRGGMNIAGAPGVVSQSLAAQGILYGGKGLAGGAGQYGNILNAVKGAGKYMNTPNDVAAKAIGGMYSGSASMGLLQNFGIYTTNPDGGQSATPVQTLAMLNDRLTGGGRMSAKQVATALGPGGALTANLQSIEDPTMRSMASQYIRDASKGKYWNNQTYGAELAKAAGGNPNQSQMDALSAQTQTMVTATSSYVEGMKDAAIAVGKFEGALNKFLQGSTGKSLARFAGGADLAMQDPAIAGAVGATAATGGAIGSILSNLSDMSMLARLGGRSGKGGSGGQYRNKKGQFAKRPWYSQGGKIGKLSGVLSKGVPVLSTALGALNVASTIANGGSSSDIGGSIGSTAGSALGGILGALVPVPGLNVATAIGGAALGGFLGGNAGSTIGSMFQGGATDLNGLGGSSDTTGAVKLSAPVSSKVPITTKYGQVTDIHGTALWGGNPHLAIDYGCGSGTSVQASGNGTVIETGSGSGSRSYGNYLIIDHGSGITTLYAHLSGISVNKGDKVSQGQVIASSGATGYVTGPHLHFETRKNGQPVNPASLGLSGSVAVVAGNTSSTASSMGDGSSQGGSNGASALGFSAGSGNSATKIPSSYMGAAIASGATGNLLAKTSATNSKFGSGGGSNSNVGGPNLDVGSSSSSGKKNYVNINVNVASATEAEARRLAKIVKDYLEEDTLMNNMRSL